MTLVICILACISLLCVLCGFVIGRISTAPPEPMTFDISDVALAHILHEAKRGYERSLGIIKRKTWNNLPQGERDLAVRMLRSYRACPVKPFTFSGALAMTIARLASND